MIHHDLFHYRLDQAEQKVRQLREDNPSRHQHYTLALHYIGKVRLDMGLKDVWKKRVRVMMSEEPFTREANLIERYVAEAVFWMAIMGITVRRFWLKRSTHWSHYVEVEI